MLKCIQALEFLSADTMNPADNGKVHEKFTAFLNTKKYPAHEVLSELETGLKRQINLAWIQ